MLGGSDTGRGSVICWGCHTFEIYQTCPEFGFSNLCPEIIFKNALITGISTGSEDLVITSSEKYGTRKAEVLNSLIINTTAKANDTTDILQTFR